jgi:ATP-dependent DNA helicase DinG
MIDLEQHFPSPFTPTDAQSKVIREISDAFAKHKFVICCAPTGSGKSMIAKTICNASNEPADRFKQLVKSYDIFEKEAGAYIHEDECMQLPPFGGAVLTVTKALQDQYERLFSDSMVLKGKSNYKCMVDEDHSVDTAPCIIIDKIKKDCWQCNKCLYYNARNESIVSRFGVFNYTMYMCLPDHVKQKQFLVCDEAAELEDELVKNFSVELRSKTVQYLLPEFNNVVDVENPTAVRTYLINIAADLYDVINELEKKVASKKNKASAAEVSRMLAAKNMHGQVKTVLENWGACEYVAEKTKNGFVISPLKVDKLSHHLFDGAHKVLLMSATIIDPANYAKSLGIEDYAYIEMPSNFDPQKAPIIVSSKYKMNNGNWEKLMPVFKNLIQQIVDQHKGSKGIIHTHNMNITNYMKEHLKGNRYLMREDGIDNEQILQKHLQGDDDTVLVSPSMTHGVDLKDDLARFQIIVKAPYLPLNSKRIKKLFTLDSQWYVNKMLTTVIQASGRGVRSKDDFCVTYILDGNIVHSILENTNKLPKYFLKRFV